MENRFRLLPRNLHFESVTHGQKVGTYRIPTPAQLQHCTSNRMGITGFLSAFFLRLRETLHTSRWCFPIVSLPFFILQKLLKTDLFGVFCLFLTISMKTWRVHDHDIEQVGIQHPFPETARLLQPAAQESAATSPSNLCHCFPQSSSTEQTLKA